MSTRPTSPIERLPAAPHGVAGSLGLSFLALVLSLTGCENKGGQEAADPSADIVASIGDAVIRIDDVEREVALRVERGGQIPDLPVLVDDMIERRLLIEKAKADGLDRDPDLVRSWENLLIGRYKENHLREELRGIETTEDEIRANYDAEPARYTRPAKARLAILTLPLSPVMSEEERKAVVERMAEGRARSLEADSGGLGFGAIAVNYSEDQVTRHRGGDTGWLDDGVEYRWPAEVVKAGFSLKPGEISEPIVLQDAVHLVRKLDERPASSIPFEQVRDQIRKEIQTTRIRSQEAAFSENLRAGTAIEIFPDAIAKIRVPDQPRPRPADAQPPAVP